MSTEESIPVVDQTEPTGVNASAEDNSIREDKVVGADLDGIDQSNIIEKRTRGVKNDAYAQERQVDDAVDGTE